MTGEQVSIWRVRESGQRDARERERGLRMSAGPEESSRDVRLRRLNTKKGSVLIDIEYRTIGRKKTVDVKKKRNRLVMGDQKTEKRREQ